MSSARDRPALILDADERQSLVAIRSLGRAGVEVHAAADRTGIPAFRSRWCRSTLVLPSAASDADAFIEALLAHCRALGEPVVFSSHDGTIEVLRERRAEIERVASLALAPPRALAAAIDKRLTLAAAGRIGIGVPTGHAVTTADEVRAALAQLQMPVVVKPSSSWLDAGPEPWRSGAVLLRTPEAAEEWLGQLLAGGAAALVQSHVSGAREAVSTLFAGGEVKAIFAQRAERMWPVLGGSSVVRESIQVPADLGELATALIRELDLEGYAEVEFRRDRDGRPLLMEINARLSASVEVAVRAGVDFPLALYQWASGGPVRPGGAYRTGVRMRWWHGDVEWLLEAVRSPDHPDAPPRPRAVATFLAEFARAPAYDWWDRGDPGPALVIAGRAPGRAARRITGAAVSRLRRRLPI